jgi:hypothetical protein
MSSSKQSKGKASLAYFHFNSHLQLKPTSRQTSSLEVVFYVLPKFDNCFVTKLADSGENGA